MATKRAVFAECVLLFIGLAAALAQTAWADSFVWTGDAGTPGWFDTKVCGSYMDEFGYWHYRYINNWGSVSGWDDDPPCDFPDEPAEDATVPFGDAVDYQRGATIGHLTIDGELYTSDGLGRVSVFGLTVGNTGRISLYDDPVYGPLPHGCVSLRGTPIVNDGLISHSLEVCTDVVVSGSGTIRLDYGNQINPSGTPASLANAAGHTIESADVGAIRCGLINRGLVQANGPSSLMLVDYSPWVTNEATMRATNGGLLQFRCPITQSADGRIVAEDADVFLYSLSWDQGVVVTGGTLITSGSGGIQINRCELRELVTDGDFSVPCESGDFCWAGLRNATNTGSWDVAGWLYLGGQTLVNHGLMVVSGTITADSNVAVAGEGTIRLVGGSIGENHSGSSLTNMVGHTIEGWGSIICDNNQGRIRAIGGDVCLSGSEVGGYPTTCANEGTIEVAVGATMGVYPDLRQTDGRIILDGLLYSCYSSNLNLLGGGLYGPGTLRSSNVSTDAVDAEPGKPLGALHVDGSYGPSSASRLSIDLASTEAGQFDTLLVTAAASLDGELHIRCLNEFTPEVGQEYTILTAGSRTGTFSSVTGSGQYDVIYGSTDVTIRVLVPPVPADINGDQVVDVSDLLYLAHAFSACLEDGAYDPDCDLSGDGCVDVSDLLVLASNFGRYAGPMP